MTGRLSAALLAIGLAALLVPVLLVPVPPLLDYPNHLARLHILVDAMVYGRQNAYFVVDWSHAAVNTAVDAAGVAIGAAVGADAAGTVLLCFAVILPPLGAALLNRSIFGGWHWWQVGFPILAWNGSLLLGLISFQIGCGLALLAAAFDQGVSRRHRPWARLATRACITAMMLAVHPFAAAFYAALLAGIAFGRCLPDRKVWASVRRRAPRLAMAAIACLAPVALYLLLTPAPPGSELPPSTLESTDRGGLAGNLLTAFTVLIGGLSTYDRQFEWIWLLPFWAFASAAVLRGPGMRAHAGILLVAAALAILAAVSPAYVLGNAATNWRIAAMVGLTAVAGCRPAMPFPAGRAAAVMVGIALLFAGLARTGWVASIWWPARADLAAVQRAIAQAPRGAVILPVEHFPDFAVAEAATPHRVFVGGTPLYWHLPTLAVAWRGAFVPTLFTGRGKQPVRARPPWDALAVPHGRLPSVHDLAVPLEEVARRVATQPELFVWRYMVDWPRQFDHVLVINADQPDRAGPPPLVALLELVADEGFAQLWRVRRQANCSDSAARLECRY
jgi:hypothetical protein